jgi:hypothetical protein
MHKERGFPSTDHIACEKAVMIDHETFFGWMDSDHILHADEHFHFLFLVGNLDGRHECSWSGYSLEDAGKAWKELSANDPEEHYHLTGWGCGMLADHWQMRWRYGKPKDSTACPLCWDTLPHQHTTDAMNEVHELDLLIRNRHLEDWKNIEQRITALAERHRRIPLESHNTQNELRCIACHKPMNPLTTICITNTEQMLCECGSRTFEGGISYKQTLPPIAAQEVPTPLRWGYGSDSNPNILQPMPDGCWVYWEDVKHLFETNI